MLLKQEWIENSIEEFTDLQMLHITLTASPHHLTEKGHSLHQVWTLRDHSFLSYAADKQTNRQKDGLENPTHADRHSRRVGNNGWTLAHCCAWPAAEGHREIVLKDRSRPATLAALMEKSVYSWNCWSHVLRGQTDGVFTAHRDVAA